MPYTMMVGPSDEIKIPATGDLFRVIEIESDVMDMCWGRGTHIKLKPCTGNEQLHAELAQAREQYEFIINLARKANVRLTRALVLAREDLAQARTELAAVDEALGEFYCPVIDPEIDDGWGSPCKDHGVDMMRQKLENRTISLQVLKVAFDSEVERRVSAQVELDRARQDAQDWRDEVGELWLDPTEAKELQRKLTAMKENRNFWFEKCHEAEAERDKARKEAQTQSDLAHRDWLNPAEAEGLRRQLARAKSDCDYWRVEWRQAHDRLEELNTAEAALADCGSRGIYTKFDNPADAIMQMAARIEKLEDETMIEVEITGKEMVQALQAERQLRREAEECYEATLLLAAARDIRRELAEQRATRAEALSADRQALAALVTLELAELLERLGQDGWPGIDSKKAACALAVEIREALDDDKAT